MVADIVISLVMSPVIGDAVAKTTSFAKSFARGHIKNPGDLENQLLKLKKTLTTIKSFLDFAEKKGERDGAIRAWLHDLDDQAYQLVNLLDEYDYVVEKQVHFSYSPSQLTFCSHMSKEINKIDESLRREIPIIHALQNLKIHDNDDDDDITQYDDDSEALGVRGQDFLTIVRLLTGQRQGYPLSGLSIVGMPGVGKTTLERSIEKWAEKENFYDLVALVSVPKKFNEKKILGVMLEYLDRSAGGSNSLDAILRHLRIMLNNKKFLLILDGVWNELDAKTWDSFISRLSSNFKTSGNTIVVTTSNENVASMLDTVGCKRKMVVPMLKHELQKLSDEECWLIMKKKVLNSSNLTSIKDPALLDIGKAIAKQCGRVAIICSCLWEEFGGSH